MTLHIDWMKDYIVSMRLLRTHCRIPIVEIRRGFNELKTAAVFDVTRLGVDAALDLAAELEKAGDRVRLEE